MNVQNISEIKKHKLLKHYYLHEFWVRNIFSIEQINTLYVKEVRMTCLLS